MLTSNTEIAISKDAAKIIHDLIFKAIKEELTFPEKSDTWMTEMQQALFAMDNADTIIIGD